jgi:branched-chain amino acid transport system permease protein
VALMIFRPQGLFPARQQLVTYAKAARELLKSEEKEAVK